MSKSLVSEQPTELEMHRVDYSDWQEAGFDSPGEGLSAYQTLLSRISLLEAEILILKEQIVSMAISTGANLAEISDQLAKSESTIVRIYHEEEKA